MAAIHPITVVLLLGYTTLHWITVEVLALLVVVVVISRGRSQVLAEIICCGCCCATQEVDAATREQGEGGTNCTCRLIVR